MLQGVLDGREVPLKDAWAAGRKFSSTRPTVEVPVCSLNAIPTRAIASSCVGAQMTRPPAKRSPEPSRNCSSMSSRSATANCRMGHTHCMTTPMTGMRI